MLARFWKDETGDVIEDLGVMLLVVSVAVIFTVTGLAIRDMADGYQQSIDGVSVGE